MKKICVYTKYTNEFSMLKLRNYHYLMAVSLYYLIIVQLGPNRVPKHRLRPEV